MRWCHAGCRGPTNRKTARASHQDGLRAQRHGNEDAKECKRDRPQQQLPGVQHYWAIGRILLGCQLALHISNTQQSTAVSPHPGHWRMPKLHGASLLLCGLLTVPHHCRYHTHEASSQRHGGRGYRSSLYYDTLSDRKVLAPAEALQRFE
jgi:hypothetical protein